MGSAISVDGSMSKSISSFEDEVLNAVATGSSVKVTLPETYRMADFKQNMIDSGYVFKGKTLKTCVVRAK